MTINQRVGSLMPADADGTVRYRAAADRDRPVRLPMGGDHVPAEGDRTACQPTVAGPCGGRGERGHMTGAKSDCMMDKGREGGDRVAANWDLDAWQPTGTGAYTDQVGRD